MMQQQQQQQQQQHQHQHQHPLRALSEENLTIISHFTGETYSQGTASDWEVTFHLQHSSPKRTAGADRFLFIQPISSDGTELMDEEQQREFFNTQLEHLTQLQQMYQQQQQQQRRETGGGTEDVLLEPTPLSVLSSSHIGSFKVSLDWVLRCWTRLEPASTSVLVSDLVGLCPFGHFALFRLVSYQTLGCLFIL